MFGDENARGTLAGVIDHVTIRLPDLVAARAFYALALELVDGPTPTEAEGLIEWNDFSISEATRDRPTTRRLHIGFQAADRVQVDRWWHSLRDAGYADLGVPGPRPEYSASYYGAFIADPVGNSVEAVHHDAVTGGRTIDHLWFRTPHLEAITVFYETVAPIVGYRVTRLTDRTRVHREGAASFSFVPGEPTENVHLAFGVLDDATVEAFHAVGTGAGYSSLGEPGERPRYHPGYYGAYLSDPDRHNIEAVHHNRADGESTEPVG